MKKRPDLSSDAINEQLSFPRKDDTLVYLLRDMLPDREIKERLSVNAYGVARIVILIDGIRFVPSEIVPAGASLPQGAAIIAGQYMALLDEHRSL